MALQDDLETEVKSIAGMHMSSPVTLPTNKGNLYELYIYLLVFDTIKKLNASASAIPIGAPLAFRCSPGRVENTRYSYVRFIKNGIEYELRNGIEVNGFNMFHEVDVAIFRNQQMNNARPPKSNLILSIECKNHAKLSSLKGESRKFLGCVTDLCSAGHGSAGCIQCGIGFEANFATPLCAAASHQYLRFLNSYQLNPMFDLRPGSRVERSFLSYVTSIYNAL